MNKQLTIAEAALQMREAGLNVAPSTEEKAPNLKAWTKYQKTFIEECDLSEAFADFRTKGVGVICGEISGGLEVVDVDTKYDLTGNLYNDLCSVIKQQLPEVFKKLTISTTKSGGAHFYYLCSSIEGNQALAKRPATKEELDKSPNRKSFTIIETRGEGGFIVTAPTNGYKVIQGSLAEIQTLTPDERNELLSICRSFSTFAEELQGAGKLSKRKDQPSDSTNPFDAYNDSDQIVSDLQAHGWVHVFTHGGVLRFRRPGKDKGTSATFNGIPNRFYCFSDNSCMPQHKSLTPYAALGYLEGIQDDWKAIGRLLLQKGFGERKIKMLPTPSSKKIKIKKEGEEDTDELQELVESLQLRKQAEEIVEELASNEINAFESVPEIEPAAFELMPELFKTMLEGLEGRRRDMALVFLLGLVSGSLKNIKVRHEGDQVPVLFSYVVAGASSGKNICSKMQPVIMGIHKKRREKHDRLMQEWRQRRDDARNSKTNFDEEQPDELKLWQTANMSAAAFNRALMNNNLVVSDTEGETLANCMKQEWGGMSEIFCKTFHQEAAGISRAGKQQVECEAPTASIAISGTDDQVPNIIKDSTSGLLSRFTFYRFASGNPKFLMPQLRGNTILESEWKMRQEKASSILMNMERWVDSVAVLSKSQIMRLQTIGEIGEVYTQILGTERAFQIVTRGVVQLIRVAAIFANFKRHDEVMKNPMCGADSWDTFEIDDESLEAAIHLFNVFFQCNIKVFAEISDLQPVKTSKGKAGGALELFAALPDVFTSGKGEHIEQHCERLGIKLNTARRYVTKWKKTGMIEEEKRGTYRKLQKGFA